MCSLRPGWEGFENAANTRKCHVLWRVLTTAGLLQVCPRTEMYFIWELQVRVFREHVSFSATDERSFPLPLSTVVVIFQV